MDCAGTCVANGTAQWVAAVVVFALGWIMCSLFNRHRWLAQGEALARNYFLGRSETWRVPTERDGQYFCRECHVNRVGLFYGTCKPCLDSSGRMARLRG